MSDKNINIDEFDLMMKSILDEAREEVPERVWEGVSVGLDKAARRKTVVLWFRRAAVGVAAAAAVVLGVFLKHNTGNELVPVSGDSGMIAVVKPEEEAIDLNEENISDEAETFTLVAEAKRPAEEKTEKAVVNEPVIIDESEADLIENAENERIIEKIEERNESESSVTVTSDYFPEDWGEEKKAKKRNVSLVLSGITGTNNSNNTGRAGELNNMMMGSSANPAPKKTGVEETSLKSSFGIPLSFGAGVKFDLSGRWSVGTGVNYTFLSRQFYGKYTKVDNSGNIERVVSSDIRNQQHYVGIPVNAFFNVISNDKINFYAYAGGAAEKCISDSYSLLNTEIRHKEKPEGVQLSANAGIGVEFMLGKHLGLYIDPSVRYYFDNNQPKSIRTVQPLMLGFEMGLRARL